MSSLLGINSVCSLLSVNFELSSGINSVCSLLGINSVCSLLGVNSELSVRH